VPEFSFEAWVHDLEAVVDAVGLERFPLLGISQGGPVAIAYAVRNPDRVSHLVLLGSFAQGSTGAGYHTPRDHELVDARIQMARVAWATARPSVPADVRVPLPAQRAPRRSGGSFDELQRRSTSPENAWRFVREFGEIDVRELAPRVQAPTLIACARREPENNFEQSRLLATLIPGSRLVPLDSCNHLLPERDPAWPAFLHELDRFLAVPLRSRPRSRSYRDAHRHRVERGDGVDLVGHRRADAAEERADLVVGPALSGDDASMASNIGPDSRSRVDW
jgi:pimeloyl-ACP methyl ester carboxylesterase